MVPQSVRTMRHRHVIPLLVGGRLVGVKIERAEGALLDQRDVRLERGPFAGAVAVSLVFALVGAIIGLRGGSISTPLGALRLLLRGGGLALALLVCAAGGGLRRSLQEDFKGDADVASDQEQVLVQTQAVERVEVAADGDPEGAQEAVQAGAREGGHEGVGEVAGEGLLREGAVGVVEAYRIVLAVGVEKGM